MKIFNKIKNEILLHKEYKRIGIAFLVCLFLIFLCELSISGEINNLQQNNQNLSLENDELNSELHDIQSSYNKLEGKYDSLLVSYADLQAELTKFQDQQETIDTLNAQLTDLQEKYDALSEENESLQQQVDSNSSNSSGNGWRMPSSDSSNGGYLPLPDASGGDMVWIPADGEKYHSIPDCGRMNPNTATQVSNSSAEAMGYNACSKCW